MCMLSKLMVSHLVIAKRTKSNSNFLLKEGIDLAFLCFVVWTVVKTGSHYVDQAGLKLPEICLSLECWVERCTLPHLAWVCGCGQPWLNSLVRLLKWWLRICTAFPEAWFPALKLDGSELFITPAPGDPTPGLGSLGHLHSYAHIYTI